MYRGSAEPVASCSWSADGERVLWASYDSNVYIRSTNGGAGIDLVGHRGRVYGCSFSADDTRVVTGGSDGELKLWDARTGKELPGPWFGHERAVWGCAFSPDRRHVFSCSEDGTLAAWDVASRALIRRYEAHDAEVWSLALSPDGRWLASASQDRTVRLWDVHTGNCVAVLSGHQKEVWSCSFLTFGERPVLVSASWDGDVKVWDASPRLTTAVDQLGRRSRHRGVVLSCAVSVDGSHYVTGTGDGAVTLWDAATGGEIASWPQHRNYVSATALSPNGQWLVSGDLDGDVHVRDLVSGAGSRPIASRQDEITACAFSRTGDLLAVASHDTTLDVFNVNAGFSPYVRLEQERAEILACGFTPDGRLVWGDEDGHLWVSLPGLRAARRRFATHSRFRSCAVSWDGAVVASGADDGSIRLWRLDDGHELSRLSGHDSTVQALAISRDGRFLASASWDWTTKIWSLDTSAAPLTLVGHTGELQDVVFSADGTRVVTAALDGTLRIWDRATGQEIGPLAGPDDSTEVCTFTVGGSRLASVSHRQAVKVWEGTTGHVVAVLNDDTGELRDCAFAPDGSTLVAAAASGVVHMWALADASLMLRFRGHEGPVDCCSYSPDGSTVISGSRDSTVRLWDARSGEELARLQHPGWVRYVRQMTNGSTLVAVTDRTISLWNLASDPPVAERIVHDELITCCGLSETGWLVFGFSTGDIVADHLGSGRRQRHRIGSAIRCCGLSSKTTRFGVGSEDGSLAICSADTGEMLIWGMAHEQAVRTCAMSPDGVYLLSGSGDGFAALWGAHSGNAISTFWAGAAVNTMSWHPAAPVAAVGDSSGRVYILRPEVI
jgi:WD40 repeat protein